MFGRNESAKEERKYNKNATRERIDVQVSCSNTMGSEE
jgi:hypothetical protein